MIRRTHSIGDIIEFIRDPNLIKSDVSPYQETALRLLYGLPLSRKQQTIACKALDQDHILRRAYAEATFICGRRSGKSERLAANVAVYEAASGGHEAHLAPGERGLIALIAQDMRAARVLFRYILAKLEDSPLLSQLIQEVRREEIDLTTGLTISIFPCSFRAPRGFSIPVAILDEVGFFRVEGVNVDKEVIDAIRPAQATFANSKLIKISSPYGKQGELYRDFATRNQRPDLLCFQATSWEMNPEIAASFLEAERARDPEYFEREYAAIFSDSITTAFSREAVEACVIQGRYELPYRRGLPYCAGVDPSGGGPDEFALSICHREADKVVQDAVGAWKSRRPADVVAEAAQILKSYRVSAVLGDSYSGEWVRQAFGDHGIRYFVADRSASDTFLELLPRLNQGALELLDEKRQVAQLIALERRTGRAGKDTLAHPAGGHDDRANALAHAARAAWRVQTRSRTWGRDQTSDLGGIYRPYPAPPVILS